MTPQKYWEHYRDTVYGHKTLSPTQESECSKAFYAGIECAFKAIDKILTKHSTEDDWDDCAEALCTFRKANKMFALAQND